MSNTSDDELIPEPDPQTNATWQVRDATGNVFGPVDATILRTWVREGRLLPEMEVRDTATNAVARSGDLPFLVDEWPPVGHTWCPHCHKAVLLDGPRVCPHCGWQNPARTALATRGEDPERRERRRRRGRILAWTGLGIGSAILLTVLVFGILFARAMYQLGKGTAEMFTSITKICGSPRK